ncbi:MAG: HAMP domain-containing protein [bacterium]|nr:HAMP domain-containing protein [bacterium]
MAFVLTVSFVAAIIGYRNLSAVVESSREIITHDVPISRAIKRALTELLSEEIALESALGVDDFEKLEDIRKSEAVMERSNLLFSAYINAIAWGSETMSFAKSGGGLNAEYWNRQGLKGKLIIKPPNEEEAQFAGAIDIYFGGFVNNAFTAVAKHKTYLRLKSDGKAGSEEARRAIEERDAAKGKALSYAGLIADNLDKIVESTNANVEETAANITDVETGAKMTFIYIFIFSAIMSLVTIFYFIRQSIIEPLNELVKVLKRFGAGDMTIRASADKADELGVLARMFNKMADDLQTLYSGMQERALRQNRDLTETINTLKREKTNLEEEIAKAKERPNL